MGDGADGMLGRSQLGRLLQIMLALRGEACPNARSLAELCEVSTRTIYRDLTTLGAAGVPVRFSPERRGYVLAPGYSLAPPRLDDAELRALIVLVIEGGVSGRAPNCAMGQMALRKLVEALPDGPQRVGGRRILDRMTADRRPSEGVLGSLVEALWHRVEVVVLWRGDDGLAEHRLAPYHLHADIAGAWYVVGRFAAEGGAAVRCEPVAHLRRIVLTDRPFVIPAGFEARRILSRARRAGLLVDGAELPGDVADPFCEPLEDTPDEERACPVSPRLMGRAGD
jgi:predicted DNA-binding transcriptional regulator YafY